MEDHDFTAEASPDQVVAAVAANTAAADAMGSHGSHAGEQSDAVSVRTATHEGHRIVVRTSYQIEVDGQPFNPHVNVDNAGRVHYHGLPTRDFASMVDLVKKAIDNFPDDFAEHAAPPPDHHDHDPPGEGASGGHAHEHPKSGG